MGENTLDISELNAGDFNGDNGINITDVSIMNAAFGSQLEDDNYNHLTDMNCEGGVNVIDVSVLNANYGLVGNLLP